ncbi:Hypothetical protein CINCED_3A014382 [Cinara cedri]|uniref:Uncharacterized protein n=1 Tax=Cinara cedri TaxID=506608 RepID=A0A5E4MBN2_9HEMI|nr:Hypothetical protein CINCED_3A014382 [Cinara cedri]
MTIVDITGLEDILDNAVYGYHLSGYSDLWPVRRTTMIGRHCHIKQYIVIILLFDCTCNPLEILNLRRIGSLNTSLQVPLHFCQQEINDQKFNNDFQNFFSIDGV